MHAEVGHVIEHAGRPRTAGKLDVQKINAANIVEPERRSRIRNHAGELYISKLDIADMAQIEMLCRQWSEPCRFRIVVRPFCRLQRSHFGRATAPVQEDTVADRDIFNGMTWDAADDRGHRVAGPLACDVAD